MDTGHPVWIVFCVAKNLSELTVTPGYLTLACADLDARPLFWTDNNGLRFGYEPDVAEAVAKRLGLTLRWSFLPWAEFGPAVQHAEADAVWCGCAITEERQRSFLFSNPYAVFHESVLTRKGAGIREPSDLLEMTVGAISGSTNMALAEQRSGCKHVGFDGNSDDVFSDMINALRAGEIDAVVDDEPAFGGLVGGNEFEIAFTVETRNRWGAAMHPDSIELKVAIDKVLDELIRSNQLRAIWQQTLDPIPFPRIA